MKSHATYKLQGFPLFDINTYRSKISILFTENIFVIKANYYPFLKCDYCAFYVLSWVAIHNPVNSGRVKDLKGMDLTDIGLFLGIQ